MGIVGAYMVPHPKELIPDIGRRKGMEISENNRGLSQNCTGDPGD